LEEIVSEVVGKCSICGGDVRGQTGMFYGKPPPFYCPSCGATNEDRPDKVIRMRKSSEDFRELPRESQQEYFGINKKD
jgi:tRNA(Ile2) C34 agmatinyltransferase TiaS